MATRVKVGEATLGYFIPHVTLGTEQPWVHQCLEVTQRNRGRLCFQIKPKWNFLESLEQGQKSISLCRPSVKGPISERVCLTFPHTGTHDGISSSLQCSPTDLLWAPAPAALVLAALTLP